MDRTADPGAPSEFPIRGWLADCSPRFRQEFLALARHKSLPAGTVIFTAGDAGNDLFGIGSGVVLVQCRFTHPDAMFLHMLWPGNWFGTLDLLARRSRRFSTVARTDVELLRVPGEEMLALLRRYPDEAGMLARNAVYGLDLAMQAAADLLIRDATARCAAVLLRLTGQRWDSDPGMDHSACIPASQAELAMLCNMSRNTFSRVVKGLVRGRLVALGYKSLTVNDPARLRIVAGGN